MAEQGASVRGKPSVVELRQVLATDVARLYEIQRDREANELAGTKPRDLETFQTLWAKVLGGEGGGVVARVIVADGEVAGSINVFQREGTDELGYWLDRAHWGRGIATRAVGLLLAEVARRPLRAQVVAHNVASLRVLERQGFVEVGRTWCAETERYVAGEVVELVLGATGDERRG